MFDFFFFNLILNAIYFQTLDNLFFTYFLFLKFFGWIEKKLKYLTLIQAVKNNFLKQSKYNLNMNLTLLILNI